MTRRTETPQPHSDRGRLPPQSGKACAVGACGRRCLGRRRRRDDAHRRGAPPSYVRRLTRRAGHHDRCPGASRAACSAPSPEPERARDAGVGGPAPQDPCSGCSSSSAATTHSSRSYAAPASASRGRRVGAPSRSPPSVTARNERDERRRMQQAFVAARFPSASACHRHGPRRATTAALSDIASRVRADP